MAEIKAAAYLRISQDRDGSGLGVDRQLQACRDMAAAKGWEIDPEWVLRENDTSATIGHRPQFERLLQGMERGEVRAVVAFKVDRLVRKLDDMMRLWRLAEDRHVLVTTVSGELDLTTASGRANALLWGVIAQIEIENMRERIERRNLQAAQAGKNASHGRRAFGWETDRKTQVPGEAAVLREMARRVLDGESLTSLARELNRKKVTTTYGLPFTVSKLKDVLSRERHAGRVLYKGEVMLGPDGAPIKAEWDPILDADTFDALQVELATRGKTPEWKGERRYLLSGHLLRCGVCDGPVGSDASRRGDAGGRRIAVYRCRGCLSRQMDKVDEYVLAEVREFARTHPIAVDSWESEERADLTAQIRRVETQLAELEDAFVTGGGDPRRLVRVTNALEAKLANLQQERLDRLAMETGRRWIEFDLDELLDRSASLMPGDTAEQRYVRAQHLEEQRAAVRLYVEHIVLQKPQKMGRGFDQTTVEIVFRDPARLKWRGIMEQD